MGLLKDRVKSTPLKRLLFLTYGGVIALAFVLVLVVCVASIYTLRARVLSESIDALRKQIIDNSGFVLAESGEVFAERLHGGVKVLALPAAYAVQMASRSTPAFSLEAMESYLDSSTSTLKAPLSNGDFRYLCLSTEAQTRAAKGCSGDTKSFSAEASSVYMAGLTLAADNTDPLLSTHATAVNSSSVIDTFVDTAWSRSSTWLGTYVALSQGRLLRVFPGYVGDLSADALGVRTYDPTTRPWFLVHSQGSTVDKLAMTNEGQNRYSLTYSEPYWSLDGNGLIISVTLPVHDADGSALLGVAGSDVQVSAIRDIVARIRLRQTGEVHLYSLGANAHVAASPQWDPQPTDQLPETTSDILLNPAGSSSGARLDAVGRCGGAAEVEESLVVTRQALGGEYCLAAVVPLSEVLEPIDSQRGAIDETANQLFIMSLLVLLGCFFGLVAPCALLIAVQLSHPLIKTSRESSTVVRNIGSNLLEGIELDDSRSSGLGEVRQLRAGFLGLLGRLRAKREQVSQAPPNACCGKLPAARTVDVEELSGISLGGSSNVVQGNGAVLPMLEEGVKVRWWSRITLRVGLQLVLPMTVALIAVIVVTTSQMWQKTELWVAPVKEAMIAEELQSLDNRAEERAKLVEDLFSVYATTLLSVKRYTERLYDGEFQLLAPYPVSFSPQQACPSGADCSLPADEGPDTKRLLNRDGSYTRRAAFSRMVYYAPSEATAPDSWPVPASTPVAASAPPVQEQEGRAAHLENIARVAYFSSRASNVYFGFQSSEVYRQYPFVRLDGYDEPQREDCNDPGAQSLSRYTPLCRPWYTNAVAASPGDVVFNPVLLDAGTGMRFVAVSAACYASSSQLIGVAALDVDLQGLEDILRNTPLYREGRAYVFDAEGYALLHPDMDASQKGRIPVHILVGGEDLRFSEAYKANVVQRWGEVGTWAFPWFNPELGEEETWHYSFRPIQGTPYQFVLTVVDRDVTEAPQRLEDSLKALLTTHAVVTTLFFVVAGAILLAVTGVLHYRFVVPVTELVRFLEKSERSGFTEEVACSTEVVSRELQAMLGNFKRLLVALRFGNPAYHKGDRLKELGNLREARALVEETGNERGVGVCLNNLGNCVRSMSAQVRAGPEVLHHERQPHKALAEAVENARALVRAGHSDVTEDTVGQRLLGLSLALLDIKDVDGASAALTEAVQLHARTRSWKNLARLAYTVATLPDEAVRGQLHGPASRALTEAQEACRRSLQPLPAQDSTALAQLCFALHELRSRRPEPLLWALERLPSLEAPLVVRLASHAKCTVDPLGPLPQQLDDAMGAEASGVPTWVKGPIASPSQAVLRQKAVLFVLDASGSMAGSYLERCKTSIRNIIDKYTNEADLIGFLAFAHFTKEIFPLLPKKGNYDMMLGAVSAVNTFGGTAFYDAVVDGLNAIKRLPEQVPKWVVALTDGADGHSKRDNGAEGCRLLREVPRANMAVITVGELPRATISVVESYAAAAASCGNRGLHIVASDTQKIAEAFEEIATLMAEDAGLTEHL